MIKETDMTRGEDVLGGTVVLASLIDLHAQAPVFVKFGIESEDVNVKCVSSSPPSPSFSCSSIGPRNHELSTSILTILILLSLAFWMHQRLPTSMWQAIIQHQNALRFTMLIGTMLIYDLFNAFLFWNEHDAFVDQEPDDWYWGPREETDDGGEHNRVNSSAHIYCLPDGRLALGV